MKTTAITLFVLQSVLVAKGTQLYVHMMPWFENKDSNNGRWGIHWTMTNKNPDKIINGQQEIASFYHPQIGTYASGDPDVIDWQLGIMKTAGVAGIFIDWPGTTQFADYPKNKQNCEVIIEGTQRAGLKFAVVYEENNLNLAKVPDKIAQAAADMQYLRDNYFNKPNYLQVNGAPLLMTFGPQALTDGNQWNQIFASLNPKPTFLTLWYQSQQGGTYNKGEYAWIYQDFMTGLRNWYANVRKPVKIGVAYPGFRPFYAQGGWPGPSFNIEYSTNTFQQTLDLAVVNTDIVQIATWNDYGEGTVVEPTKEFGTQFVDIIQRKSGTKYNHPDFLEVALIYHTRKHNANNATLLAQLKQQYHNLMHKYD